ncbi:hypothetical protein HHK36_020769 [Tetracentron sinense]|uniref:Phytocyanin domain-containing protein n=1 Tax=Tetracentron sinense TaxID=13715 RepID=A0A835D8N9_TETSI|nr:hypothetical protein HHK36_020769 [Tetracentron sinense]
MVFVGLATKEAFATQHVVGGSQGWDLSTDLSTWASGRTFKVGDQLVNFFLLAVFKYTTGLHSVVEFAGESDYKNCNIGSVVDSKNGGNNAIKLSKPGTRYFACGSSGHCGGGMKLKIKTVAADGSSSPTTPSSSSTPTSTAAATAIQSYTSFVVIVVSITIGLLGMV